MRAVVDAIESGGNNAIDIAGVTNLPVSLVQAILGHLERSGQLAVWQVGSGTLSACAGCSGCGTTACAASMVSTTA